MDFVWSVTGHCNLKCPGCWDPFANQRAASFESMLQTLKSLDLRDCRVVTFTGGEPLLHRDLCKLIRQVRDRGVPQVKICTNGTLLRKRARDLIDAGVTEVHVSLDSTQADAHSSIGNADSRSSAEAILAEIGAFRDEVQARHADLRIVMVSVLDPREVGRFERVLEYARFNGYRASYQLLCPFAIWLPEIRSSCEGIVGLFCRLEELHRRFGNTLHFFDRIYLAAAKRYVLTGTHQPCGAGEAFQVIDPTGKHNACYRHNADPVNMGCFDEKCLIWIRSSPRGERVLRIISDTEAKRT